MGLFTSINIASTGMAAERLRSDVISDNIANAAELASMAEKLQAMKKVLPLISEANAILSKNF